MTHLLRPEALDLARRALPSFGISEDSRIEFVKYRENIVFRVIDVEDAYAMRIHRLNHRTAAEVRTENTYMQALFTAGLAVSEVVPTADDEVFTVVTDAQGREHQIDVQRWVPASAPLGDCGDAWMGEEQPSVESFAQLGEICGQFHAVSSHTGRIPGYSRQPWDLDGLVGVEPLWGDPRRLAATEEDRAVVNTALQGIRQQLEELGTDGDVYGVIHADFSPENVLLSGEELTLIDFDDFGEGWWLFDLATVLFWYHRHPWAQEYREALLAGYQKHFEITDAAQRALEALILARGLTYLGWAADRPDNETSAFLRAEVLPAVVELCRDFTHRQQRQHNGDHTMNSEASDAAASNNELIERRNNTIGPYSPLFYKQARHFVAGEGVWLTDVSGQRYLDAYNNVPHVGHANARVADAVSEQLHTYNVHTRYLSEPVVNYAEQLLSTFNDPLDRVYFTNSGSESNELALRIARHRTGNSGIIVTDHSYHGNTITLAALTTGLQASEPRGKNIATIHVPDAGELNGQSQEDQLSAALAEIDAAIASLNEQGFGVSALLVEPIFSTEGLPSVPAGYLTGLVGRVQAAGGLIISDEVQAGLGRLGDDWWAHQATSFLPDLVTLGKPLGNGYPLGGVVTTAEILEDFSSQNEYFNTFAGTPAAAAAGSTVLAEIRDRDLVRRTGELGRYVAQRLEEIVRRHRLAASTKGRGLFFGLTLVDEQGEPDAALAKRIVEYLVNQRILISKIGPNDNVLKIRPPVVISQQELDTVLDALDAALSAEESTTDSFVAPTSS